VWWRWHGGGVWTGLGEATTGLDIGSCSLTWLGAGGDRRDRAWAARQRCPLVRSAEDSMAPWPDLGAVRRGTLLCGGGVV
jgi:hypothetical protein